MFFIKLLFRILIFLFIDFFLPNRNVLNENGLFVHNNIFFLKI